MNVGDIKNIIDDDNVFFFHDLIRLAGRNSLRIALSIQ